MITETMSVSDKSGIKSRFYFRYEEKCVNAVNGTYQRLYLRLAIRNFLRCLGRHAAG